MSVTLYEANCLDVLRSLPENVIDSVVTDPPYGLEFMNKEWDGPKGFKSSLSDADRSGWQGGGGFTKPGIGERKIEWPSFSATGRFGAANPTCGTCGGRLRGAKRCACPDPKWKPIGKRRNPENEGLSNAMTGGGMVGHMRVYQTWCEEWAHEVLRILKPGGHLLSFGGTRTYHRMAVAIEDAGFEIRDQIGWLYGTGFPKSHNLSDEWDGWGTALKPAWEPLVLARKPLIGTVAETVLAHGTGALNIDGCRVPTEERLGGGAESITRSDQKGNEGWTRPRMDCAESQQAHAARVRSNVKKAECLGRWPANVIHDGSDEVEEAFATFGKASRFFYSAKASQSERDGSKHPTVKPVSLMRYLCRLVTPPGGTVLDPFAGTGSTGQAAVEEGFNAVLIEREAAYCKDIRRRLALYIEGEDGPPLIRFS